MCTAHLRTRAPVHRTAPNAPVAPVAPVAPKKKGPTPRGHATPGLQSDMRLHHSELELLLLSGHANDLSADFTGTVHGGVDVEVYLPAHQRLHEVVPGADALVGARL